ncbi:MAG: hypothetical protein RLZZ308_312 [Candidatus Parcubacteria bacterium]|jgi:heat shock protein HslJ
MNKTTSYLLLIVLVLASIFSVQYLLIIKRKSTHSTTPEVKTFTTVSGNTISVTNTHPVNEASSTVTIVTEGFENNTPLSFEIDKVTDIFFSDLNNDTFEELIFVTVSNDDEKRGNVTVFTTYKNISLTKVNTPEITEADMVDGGLFASYEGHDTFSIVDSKLIREFWVQGDTKSTATPTVQKKVSVSKTVQPTTPEVGSTTASTTSTEVTVSLPTSSSSTLPTEPELTTPKEIEDAVASEDKQPPQEEYLGYEVTSEDIQQGIEDDTLTTSLLQPTKKVLYTLTYSDDTFSLQVGDYTEEKQLSVIPTSSLVGTSWFWLSATEKNKIIQSANKEQFILSFDETTMNSTTDCNTLHSTYILEQQTLAFGPIASTMKFCENSQEALYSTLLQKTSRFTVKGSQLVLTTSNGTEEDGLLIFIKK